MCRKSLCCQNSVDFSPMSGVTQGTESERRYIVELYSSGGSLTRHSDDVFAAKYDDMYTRTVREEKLLYCVCHTAKANVSSYSDAKTSSV